MKLPEFVSSLKSVARSPGTVYLAASVLSRVGGIFLIPIYTRRLTTEDYGTYALFASVLALLPTIFSLGLNAGLSKAYFDAKDDQKGALAFGAVTRGLLLVAAAWTAVSLAVGLMLPAEWFAPLSPRHIALLAFSGFGTVAYQAGEYFFRIREKPIFATAFPLSNFLLTAGLGIGLVLGLDRGLEGAMEAPAIASVVVGFFSLVFLLTQIPAGAVRPATLHALSYSLPFVPHLFAGWLQSAGDRWVISFFGNTHTLGTYYLAVQLMGAVSMVVISWNQGVWPVMGRTFREQGFAALKLQLWHYQKRAVLIAAGTSIAIHLALPLLSLLVGPRFLPAFAHMPWLAVILTLDALYYPAQNIIFFAGRTRLIPVVTATSTFCGLVLSALLLPPFGIAGLLSARVAVSLGQMLWLSSLARRVTEIPKDPVALEAPVPV